MQIESIVMCAKDEEEETTIVLEITMRIGVS